MLPEASPIRALGSYLGWVTANRTLGQGWRMRGLGSQTMRHTRLDCRHHFIVQMDYPTWMCGLARRAMRPLQRQKSAMRPLQIKNHPRRPPEVRLLHTSLGAMSSHGRTKPGVGNRRQRAGRHATARVRAGRRRAWRSSPDIIGALNVRKVTCRFSQPPPSFPMFGYRPRVHARLVSRA